MRLRAISFNHDSTSHAHVALNLRRNATEFVTVPEWQENQVRTNGVAYAIAPTIGRTITIKARLSAPEFAGQTIQLRVRPAPPPPWLLLFFPSPASQAMLAALWDHHAGALGSVRPTQIAVGTDGEVRFVELELLDPPFRQRGIGAYHVNWIWEFREHAGAAWQLITTTTHRVYALLDVPTAPWVQQPYDSNNTQLPWTDVLDWACRWATGRRSAAAAAAETTAVVFLLGASTIAYGCRFGAPPYYSFLAFDCTAFLDRLEGGRGNGRSVNCSDCATIVSTFANALGCDLWQSQMFDPSQPFAVNAAQLIGDNAFRTVCGLGVFVFHEVAWTDDCDEDDLVYDACLAGVPRGSLTPIVPAGLPFGRVGQRRYRQLLATQIGQFSCRPQPQTRDRRFVI